MEKRMPLEKIKDDTEDLKIKGKKIISIEENWKIMPKFQFMGLIKIMNKDFFKLKNSTKISIEISISHHSLIKQLKRK